MARRPGLGQDCARGIGLEAMRRTFRTLLLSTLVFTAMAGVACAEAPPDLNARVAELERMLGELKAQIAAQQQRVTPMPAEPPAQAPAKADVIETPALRPAEATGLTAATVITNMGFQVGDVRLSFGGVIDLDMHLTDFTAGTVDSNSIARDFYFPGSTPVGGRNPDPVVDFTAQASRLYFDAERNFAGDTIRARIEIDFLGSLQGDERVTSSFAPRLRLAYFDFAGWRFGQDWTTFQNTSAVPESASFVVLGEGLVFVRQPLIRYTRGGLQIALENPDTTIATASGERLEADTNAIPDLVVRYNWKGAFGNISAAVLARQLKGDLPGVADDAAFGWGLTASGLLKLGRRDDLRFNFYGGEGIGRYAAVNTVPGALVDPLGTLSPLPVAGGLLAWRHPFSSSGRFSVGVAGLIADNPAFAAETLTRQAMSTFLAVLFDVAPSVTVGGEILYGERTLESGASGAIRRLTLSARYAF